MAFLQIKFKRGNVKVILEPFLKKFHSGFRGRVGILRGFQIINPENLDRNRVKFEKIKPF